MNALQKDKNDYTYADYKELKLAEGERYEIIRGKVFAMPAPNAGHQAVLAALASQFSDFLEDKPHKAYPAPYDVRLFYREDESDDIIVQPDIVVVCDEKKRGQEGCRGAPDLVVEILSPLNTAIEMEQKLNLYREAGVREYWVIDPENHSLTVYCFRETGNVYNYKNTAIVPVAVLPGLNIELERVFKSK
jgi:Uma2 family endonuclease